jgi:ParB family transcriptional regulator, chromosome partitioning protein
MAAARRSGLGRGLDALLAVDATPDEGFALLAVDAIAPNPRQPRTRFDDEALESLAASIEQVGVLQPIVVGPVDSDGNHPLIAGERRLRAARLAGLSEIPAIIRKTDELSSLAEAVIENVQREDLGPLEEAAAYRSLMEDFEMTHEAVAERVGKSRSAITNTVRLLNLAAPIQALLSDGMLSAGAARALLGVDDQAAAVSIAEKAAAEGWSVRQVEDAARSLRDEPDAEATGGSPATVAAARPAQIIALEERLSDRLGAPVRISYGRGGGGRLTVRFGSVDDLERIYRGLLGAVDA